MDRFRGIHVYIVMGTMIRSLANIELRASELWRCEGKGGGEKLHVFSGIKIITLIIISQKKRNNNKKISLCIYIFI